MTENSKSHSTESLIIPKLLQKVSLWVHPEGIILGSIYISEHSNIHDGHECPVEVLNSSQDFIVLKRDDSEALRFYNKTSIVRVEYTDTEQSIESNAVVIQCKIYMMDGSLLEGTIKEDLPQTHSRLFDYINDHSNRFIKLHLTNDEVMLINKSYVIRINPIE